MSTQASDNARVRVLTSFFLLCAAAGAQHSNGYVFGGVTGVTNSIYTRWRGTLAHVGFGGEGSIGRHFTVGGEAGAILTSGNNATALLSFNPAFYFRGERAKLDPFVTAGGSLLTRGSSAGLWNLGGGVNYWFHRHLGVRLEFRDHVWPTEGVNIHLSSFRAGLAFR